MDFVKEGKLDDEIKRRQAEWERVRKKDDPIEAPAEVFDNRTLYDKLKEQHDIKKKEFEDQYALKNQIRGIDTDESEFLNEIDEARLKHEKLIRMEEKKEVEEVKKAKSAITSSILPKITLTVPTHKKENKQAELLSSVVVPKRKLSNSGTPTSSSSKSKETTPKKKDLPSSSSSSSSSEDEGNATDNKRKKIILPSSQIVLGVLPGLGEYDSNSSSLSDDSSENDDDSDRGLDTSNVISRGSSSGSAASQLSKS